MYTITPAAPSTPARAGKTLIVVDGRKGGVGATMASKALLEYLHDAGVSGHRAYDTDGPQGDLARTYPQETVGLAPSIDGLCHVIDDLMSATGPTLAIVDVGRGSARDVDNWLIERGPAMAARTQQIALIYVYVLGPSAQSVKQLSRVHDMLNREGVPFTLIVLRNAGLANSFDIFDQSQTRATLLRAEAYIADLPRMAGEAWQIPDTNDLRFRTFADMTDIGGEVIRYTVRAAVDDWLRKTGALYDALPPIAALAQLPSHGDTSSATAPTQTPEAAAA